MRDQALFSQLDVGLQKQQPHPIKSKRHRLRACSRGDIYIFRVISLDVFPLLAQPLSTWFPLEYWSEQSVFFSANPLFLRDSIISQVNSVSSPLHLYFCFQSSKTPGTSSHPWVQVFSKVYYWQLVLTRSFASSMLWSVVGTRNLWIWLLPFSKHEVTLLF